MKVAVCGFRHMHMCQIVSLVQEHPRLELAAVAESDPESCRAELERAEVEVTHRSIDAMLDDADCDIVALADVFAARGAQAIKALKAGKHVVSDKPLCTSLAECDEIIRLSREKKRSVIVQLTMRYEAEWYTARRALLDGMVGEVATVAVFGRHCLNYNEGRPAWYFEPGLQGGTLNDLAVHAIDGLEWMTGLRIDEIVAARAWNQELADVPSFQDSAQAMLRLDNGAGVIMDCSYKAPKGHSEPWLLQFHGPKGELTVSCPGKVSVRLRKEPARDLELVEAPTTYIDDLVNEIEGSGASQVLTTEDSLRASRTSLLIQKAADEGRAHLRV